MNWHEESLTGGCRDLLRRLGGVPAIGDFYLAGGTALALRLGHRISVDLDFFSKKNPLETIDRARIKEELARCSQIAVDEEKDGTIHARMSDVHVSLFHYTPRLLDKTDAWSRVRLASVIDIGAMKLSALVGRGSRKDFIDLYAITKGPVPLRTLLSQSQKKFRHAADFTAQALRALVYFKDAEAEDPPRLLTAVSWKEIKKHFESEIRSISREFLK